MANEETREFWEQRFSNNGHNGFTDPVLYSIDQSNRLKEIDKVLENTQQANGRVAIDFGCGDGDFTELLIRHGYKVYGIEISKNALIHCQKRFERNFFPLTSNEFINYSDSLQANIILSVTTLQHLVEDHDYKSVLNAFEKHAKRNATLIVLEKVKGSSVRSHSKLITVVRADSLIIDDFTQKKFSLTKCIQYNETFHILLCTVLKLKSKINWSKSPTLSFDKAKIKHPNPKNTHRGLVKQMLYLMAEAIWFVKPVRPLLTKLQEHKIFIFQKHDYPPN